jgi:membrane fusion protein, multidrug efflux system
MARLTRWRVGLLMVAGLSIGIAVWLATKSSATAKANEKPSAKPLEFLASELEQPRSEALPLVIDVAGPLTAPKTATVRAKTAATLLRLEVAEGARVKAGQRIGQLDLASLNASVTDRNAALESAKASHDNAQRQYTANQNLAQQNFISATALESQRAQLQVSRAQMLSAQAALTTAQLALRDASLTAPIDGIVSKRHAVPGEKVTPEQNIVTIVDLRNLELAGTVPTYVVALLTPGMPVLLQAEGVAQPVQGRIERIAPAAETGTRSIGVYVAVDNPKELLRAGQYATATANVGDPTPRLTVPASALTSLSGEEYVWTIEQDKLARRIVTTGRKDAATGRVEIVRGLQAGVPVLAAKFDNLKDGAAATVVNVKTVPATAGAPAVANN